jgi:hypothetical protein
MKKVFAVMVVLGTMSLCLAPVNAATSVYFDVANAGNGLTSLAPSYTNGANALASATALAAHGVNPSYDSDLGSPGDFLFTGWGSKYGNPPYEHNHDGTHRNIDFSITATQAISFGSLKYSVFSGIWSNMGGPHCLVVYASRNNFATNTLIRNAGWRLYQTLPYITDCPNDFVDDLSGLGVLGSGQTMSFRFEIGDADYGQIAAGFWNKSVNDFNPTLELVAVPEPSSLLALLTGAAGLCGFAFRRRK